MARPGKTEGRVLRAVRANVGIELAYRKKMLSLIEEMATSVEYWLKASYRQNEPIIAQDDLPANALRDAIRKMTKRWNERFDEASEQLARYFAQDVASRSDAALRKILKDAGIAIDFTMTRAMRDIVNATVAENVSLIKSIPQRYLTNVEGIVMRGVTTGMDLGSIAKSLQHEHGVTKRRAALISRDQSNKANAAFTRARQIEIGIEEAIWRHSHAGKTPRKTHQEMDGKTYSIKQGMWDPAVGRYIWPGTEINCRCYAKAVVKGFG